MMIKEKFVERMTQKLTYGDTISNEDIMRGIIMILQSDVTEKTSNENDKCQIIDTKSIAMSFYNAHFGDMTSEIEDAAKKLRKEVSYIQYTEIVAIIHDIGNYRARTMSSIMAGI